MRTKRRVIIKLADGSALKYRGVTNLPNLIQYVEQKFGRWYWVNVYSYENEQLVGSFTWNKERKQAVTNI